MLHDDVIVTHIIMTICTKSSVPISEGRGSAMPDSHRSQPMSNTFAIHIPSKVKMSYPKIYQANQIIHTKSSQWKLLDLSAIILSNL